MVRFEGPRNDPPRAHRSLDDRIEVRDAHDALRHQTTRLAIQCERKTIRNEAGAFSSEHDRRPAEAPTILQRPFDDVARSLGRRHDLQQRHDVRRIVRMDDQHPLLVLHPLTLRAGGNARRATPEQRIAWGVCFDLRPDDRFEGRIFRTLLLHDGGAGDGAREVRGEGDALGAGDRIGGDEVAGKVRFDIRLQCGARIEDGDGAGGILGQVERGKCEANNAGADDGDDFCRVGRQGRVNL